MNPANSLFKDIPNEVCSKVANKPPAKDVGTLRSVRTTPRAFPYLSNLSISPIRAVLPSFILFPVFSWNAVIISFRFSA